MKEILALVVSALVLVSGVLALYGKADNVEEITPDNFRFKVLNSEELWVIEFYAPWCAHCRAMAPEWKKVAAVFKNIIKVGAINADEHSDLGSRYDIPGFPTIKFFGENKQKPVDFAGERNARGIIEFCIAQIRANINSRLTSSEKEGEAGRGKGKPTTGRSARKRTGNRPDVVEVTDRNFEEEVIQDKGLVMVQFSTPWCSECKNFAEEWKQAAGQLRGRVKFCSVDGTVSNLLVNRYQVSGYPAIKMFPPGKKTGTSVAYDGGRKYQDIVLWVKNKLATVGPAPTVYQIINENVLLENCEGYQLCIIAVLPNIFDCQARCRRKYIKTLTRMGEKFKQYTWGWLWMEAGKQPDLEETLEIGGFGYPALAAVNSRKMKFSLFKGQFSETGINEFLRDLTFGKGSTLPMKHSEFPNIIKHDPWDGRDAHKPPRKEL